MIIGTGWAGQDESINNHDHYRDTGLGSTFGCIFLCLMSPLPLVVSIGDYGATRIRLLQLAQPVPLQLEMHSRLYVPEGRYDAGRKR